MATPDTKETKRTRKLTATVHVLDPKWKDPMGQEIRTREATYDPDHPDETVGAVVDRFTDQQGMPHIYTFVLKGKELDRNMPMPKVPEGVNVTLAVVGD